jgi:Flp pilus assembly pilin Flp
MIETPNQDEPKKSNTGLMLGIGAIVVVLLVCCCAVVVIAAVTIMGPAVGKVFSSINNSLLTPQLPSNFQTPDLSGVPTFSSDLIPQGGRGDDVVRASAWAYVLVATSTDGCSFNPKASDTTIKVTQEPDSDGVWKEEWTVACDDGSKKPYNVTFTPSASGGTDIKVTSGK